MVGENTLARNELFTFDGTFFDLRVNVTRDWFVLHATSNVDLTRRIIKLVRRISSGKTHLSGNTSAKEALEMLELNVAQFEMEAKKETLQGSESFVPIVGHARICKSRRGDFLESSISIVKAIEQGHQ